VKVKIFRNVLRNEANTYTIQSTILENTLKIWLILHFFMAINNIWSCVNMFFYMIKVY